MTYIAATVKHHYIFKLVLLVDILGAEEYSMEQKETGKLNIISIHPAILYSFLYRPSPRNMFVMNIAIHVRLLSQTQYVMKKHNVKNLLNLVDLGLTTIINWKKISNLSIVPFIGFGNGGNTCYSSTVLHSIGLTCSKGEIIYTQHFLVCVKKNPLICIYCQTRRIFYDMIIK